MQCNGLWRPSYLWWQSDTGQPPGNLVLVKYFCQVYVFLVIPSTQQTRPRMAKDSKLPLPQGSPFMSRMRRLNMRPFVIAGAFFIMLWSITCASASYLNVPFLKTKHDTDLAAIYNIMASIHVGVVVIEVFGIVAAARRRAGYVRIHAYLSIVATLMIATAGSIQMGVHYNFKDTILDLCRNVGVTEIIFFPAFFGPWPSYGVDDSELEEWCKDNFNHDSLSNIIALPVASSCAALFVILVFAHFRQLRDLTSVDNFSRESVRTAPDEFVPPPPQYEGL